MLDTIIKNANIVTDKRTFQGEIGIKDGKIAEVVEGVLAEETLNIIDAEGKYVLPGLIDSHVHLNHPNKCGNIIDNFFTGTKSAAFGGDTAVCDFAIQWDHDRSITETCEIRRKVLSEHSVIDFAFHACPTVSSKDTVDELRELINGTVPSVKMYMTYSRQNRMSDDAILYEALKMTAENGGIVGVHAENDAMCNYFADEFAKEGKTSPHFFPLCKVPIVEAEATNRAAYLARVTGGRLFIFHVTCRETLDVIREARAKGTNIYGETCTQYLTLDKSYLDRDDGALYICSPPLREKEDNDALWEAINDVTIQLVTSDHCGFTRENKAFGNNEFAKTPNGLPGMETRLPAIYTYGVKTGKISMEKMVSLLSTNPAKMFGMYPKKGNIAPGADADLVIFDPSVERVISPEVLHSVVDWNPFNGHTLFGRAEKVILRGNLIVDGDELLVGEGNGTYIERSKNDICRYEFE